MKTSDLLFRSMPRRITVVGLTVLVAAIFAVYWHGIGNSLVFDDARLTDGTIMGVYGGFWPWHQRLLSFGSFVWLADWFGPDNYVAQRIFNIALHGATTVAVALLTRSLLTQWQRFEAASAPQNPLDEALDRRLSPRQLQARLPAALLLGVGWFALNPVAVYATAYLIQRSILMAAFFTALACWAWVRALQVGGRGVCWRWGLLAAFAAALAFLSKEQAVMVPLLAVPLFIYVRRPRPGQVLLVLGLAALAMGVFALALWPAMGHLVGAGSFDATSAAYVQELNRLNPGAAEHIYALSVLNEARLFFAYLGYWLFPNISAMSVDMRPVFPLGFFSPLHLVGALAFVALSVVSAWALLVRRDGWALFAACVLCVQILFCTEFITSWIQDPFVLYRSYLWAIFLPTGLALVLLAFPQKLIYGGGLLALLLLAALSYERIDSFATPHSLWSDAADKVDMQAPANAFGRWRAFQNLGSDYLERGIRTQTALNDFTRAVALGEPLGAAQLSRGMALQMLGRYPESVAAFEAARRQGIDDPSLYYQLAVSLRDMGDLQAALQASGESLRRDPQPLVLEQLLLMRAEIFSAAHEFSLAAQEYRKLLQSHPDEGKYLVGLGMSYFAENDNAAARTEFDKALSVRAYAPAYFARALLSMREGDLAQARADAARAVAVDAKNPLYQQMNEQLQQHAGDENPAQVPHGQP